MKKILLFILCCYSTTLLAQSQDSIQLFNKERLSLQKKGMAVLGGWAIANIGVGIVGSQLTDGSTAKFHEMNAIWNVVNLGLALPGYIGAAKGKTVLGFRQSYKEQKNVEKTFLFNAAVDAAYIVGGLYFVEKSKNTLDLSKKATQEGYGNSIMLQGGFLMAFDMVMYLVHNRHGAKKLDHYLDKISVSNQGIGYRSTF